MRVPPSRSLSINVDDDMARSLLGHGYKDGTPVYDSVCTYAKRDNVERPQAWYPISRDTLAKNKWLTQLSNGLTHYYNIERYQNGGGAFAEFGYKRFGGALEVDWENGGAYFYDLKITHTFALRAELKEAFKYDQEAPNAADGCGKAHDVCGDQYIKAIHCGTFAVSRVREDAFSADGQVKADVIIAKGAAGASLNSVYSQQTGRVLEGCFLVEPEDFSKLLDHCPQRDRR